MFLAIGAHAQNNINNYRYVIVPEKFGFAKSDNQYGLNTLTRALLEGVGFTAYMEGDPLPPAVAGNKCSALRAELEEKKKFLSTGLVLLLKDCQGNVVYKSEEGRSREKEWQTAYSEALQNVFTSVNAANYKYDSTTTTAVAATPIPTTPALPPATPATVADSKDVLYAQANANGYQLIDTSPKKVMTLLKTSQAEHFIADDGVAHGVVFRKNGEWFFEYYKDDTLVSQKLNIKF
jgi:hypothetical protein